jgi:glucokinase
MLFLVGVVCQAQRAEAAGRPRAPMSRTRFVVLSGIPASGKTTVARALSRALDLPLIDKDDVLESLFETRGTGDSVWRRQLSRESDEEFKRLALASPAAVVCSFWHVTGMPASSGTPADWLMQLPRPLVHVRCTCDVKVAIRRFRERTRHAGHLDQQRDFAGVVADLAFLVRLPPLALEPRIDVDTTDDLDLNRLAWQIQSTTT